MTEPLGEKATPQEKPAHARGGSPAEAKAAPVEGERVCTACGRRFGAGTLFCPDDGSPLEVKGQKTSDPYLGQVILDHIEIQRLAGVGAMGRVYRAFQRGLDRDVAVKVLHRELSANKELVGRFIREAKLASRIVHPNVVQVHLAGQLPDGALYIVMEYLDGLSLQSAMAASPTGALALERSLHVALQLCEAVGEAHELGIVHRDLKPENVMLVRRSTDPSFVKVLDFGIARANQAEHTSMATAQGLIFGTARYISPEGARGEPATAASDVYSMAILFYQLLCGRTPFDAEQAVGLLLQHIHETPPPLVAPPGLSALPAAICRVVLDNLAKNPEDRAASAKIFGEQLRKAARGAGLMVPEVEGVAGATPAPLGVTPAPPSPESTAHRAGGTQIGDAKPRATEFAEPGAQARGLTDNGTLRIDTPPPAMLALAVREQLTPGPSKTLPVVSRTVPVPPAELRSGPEYRELPRPPAVPATERPARPRTWLWLFCIPLFLAIGLVLGGVLKPSPKRPVQPLGTDPGVASVQPAPTQADLAPQPTDDLPGLLPEQKPRTAPPGPRPNPAAPASGAAAEPSKNVRVTVGRASANPVLNQPLEFTAVVFDGQDRAGSKVDAPMFTFRGEGMNTVLPATLDGQGIFRVQLTFYKAGTYDVTFGGLLNGRTIGGTHRFTIAGAGDAAPKPSAPPLPGPNPQPAPAPKPSAPVQWL